MAVTTYRAANFQTGLTLNMPGGTGTGTSTWTLNQSTASLPTGTFRFLVYTDENTFSTTKEICEGAVTGGFTVNVTLRNAEGDTTAVNHPNGSIFAIVNTAGMENAQNDAIADLYTLNSSTVSIVSGEAFSIRDALYIKSSDGRAYKAGSNIFDGGTAYCPLFAAQAAAGAALTVSAYSPGALISGFSGLTLGAPYYAAPTAGSITTTIGKFNRVLGYAVSSTDFLFVPGRDGDNVVLRGITAGENWTVGDVLYHKKSNGAWYRADSDTAESGICEEPAIAFSTHSTGAGVDELVYLPGSNFFSVLSGASGDRAYPSATTGAIALNTPPSYDTFYRVLGFFFRANSFEFTPQEMQFLPTGIQEKGYCGMGVYTDGSFGKTYTSVHNFVKKMVNTPSSLTLTVVNQAYIDSVTVASITRFGFRLDIVPIAVGRSFWEGTYVTVGN